MRQGQKRFMESSRITKVKLSMNRVKQVLAERERALARQKKKARSCGLIRAERENMKCFVSELLLRKGPRSYAQIGATLYRDETRGRVVDSYGGVRAFCRKQMGTFRIKEEIDEVEVREGNAWVAGTAVSLSRSVVRLRPIVAARTALEDPPAIEALAKCWKSNLGGSRKQVQAKSG